MVKNYDPEARKETPEPQPAKTRRIEIPIEPYDAYLMRDVADILRGMASQLDFWARMTDRDEREKRVMSLDQIDHANRQIRDRSKLRGYYWRAGRPTNKEMGRIERNKPETDNSEQSSDPLHLVK